MLFKKKISDDKMSLIKQKLDVRLLVSSIYAFNLNAKAIERPAAK